MTRIRSKDAFAALLALSFSLLPLSAIMPVQADPAANTAQPLPFLTIEGTGGGAITPTAYLSNPTPNAKGIGKPSFAVDYINFGKKSNTAILGAETLFGRLELSVGADQLQLGTLPAAITKATGVDIGKSSATLYSFNARYLLLKESPNIPAVTFGVSYKDNSDISAISSSLNSVTGGKGLGVIGYKGSTGEDYTLTATKLFPKVAAHPLILTGGLLESKAADVGFLGFGSKDSTSFEGHVIYLPTSNIVLAYEYRGQVNPYNEDLAPLVGKTNNWNAFDAGYIINPNSTIVVGYGQFGNLANESANSSFWVQLKDNL
jgi:hypothetical protein